MSLPAIPPLENGDHLTRQEFEQRYEVMSPIKKAELLEGIVYMASPLRLTGHAQPHAMIIGWLATYWAATPDILLADNATVRLSDGNEVQPDALLRLPESMGGQSRISQDDYLEGGPELIVEVAASSASYDFHIKRKVYHRNRVPEYLLWRVYEQQFDWFVWQAGEYGVLSPDEQGLIHSQVFPGLVLAVSALLGGDYAKVLTELRKRTQTLEHATFVEQLTSSRFGQ